MGLAIFLIHRAIRQFHRTIIGLPGFSKIKKKKADKALHLISLFYTIIWNLYKPVNQIFQVFLFAACHSRLTIFNSIPAQVFQC